MAWMNKRPPALFVVALLSLSILLRSLIAAVPPVLGIIKEDLGLSTTTAGLLTTVPVLCFGLFAFIAPVLAKQLGTNRTLFLGVLIIALGAIVKIWPTILGLFLGTVLIGIGVAIGNVLILVSIRENYPLKMPAMMSGCTASMNIGAALGASLTLPVMEITGWEWNLALGAWCLPIAAILLIWFMVLRTEDQPIVAKQDSMVRYRELLKQRTPILITAYLAIQSGVFYSLLTWLPEQMIYGGIDRATAGLLLGLFAVVGFVGAMAGPYFSRARFITLVMFIIFVPYITGSFFIIGGQALIGVIMVGFGQGASFAAGMTLIADLPDRRLVASVSAFSQGIAYFFAALGPIGIGAIETMAGNWLVPVYVETAMLIAALLLAILTLRSIAADRAAYELAHN